MINISTVAFQARNTLRSSGVSLSQTTMLELMASCFGYGTYAALKLDVDPSEMYPEADHVILQSSALPKRMLKLGMDVALEKTLGKAVLDTCVMAVADEERPCLFHASMEDFLDYSREDLQTQAFNDDDVNSAYAGTNAYIDEFYTDEFDYEPMVDADDEWIFVATGSHTGEVDQDRPYSGHAGNFTATYTFEKDGRCGLVERDLSFMLDFDRGFDQD